MSSPQNPDRGATGSPVRRAAPRRGVTVILVLLLLAVTLALSYSLVRTQSTCVAIQQNAARSDLARQAALTGLTMGIKRMQTADWEGADAVYSRPLDAATGFHVEFRTGDAALQAGDPDYGEYPYRVTLVCTGYAVDPADPTRRAEHRAQAVMRLVPRALAEEPSGWSDVTGHTVCQYTSGNTYLELPCRIEGESRWRSKLGLSEVVKWDDDERWEYYRGLRQMREAGVADYRPFTARVKLPSNNGDALDLLQALGISATQTSTATAFAPSVPSGMGYRLYTGGRLYGASLLGSSVVRNTTLGADPRANPLGIYYREGPVELQSGAIIRGSLITLGGGNCDIEVTGSGVEIAPVELPALQGTDLPIRLPTILSADDLTVYSGAGLTVEGVVMVPDVFEVEEAGQYDISLLIEGHLAARHIYVRPREEWVSSYLTKQWWSYFYGLFASQPNNPSRIPYWPLWLDAIGFRAAPRIVLKADSRAVAYHWHSTDSGIFVPLPSDGGLRWELIRWTDNAD